MTARVFAIIAASSLFLAVAAAPGGKGGNTSQCNGGAVTCCNQVQQATSVDKSITKLLTLAGADVTNLSGLVGSNCSPVSVMGGGSGGNCLGQQVCCQNNYYNGLINVGCSPVGVQV